jgi:hypothetical protein
MKEAEMQQQQQMQQEMLASQEKQKQIDMQFKAEQADLDRQNDVLLAEIKAAGYGSMMDINKNMQSDYQDALAKIQQQENYKDTMDFKRESQLVKNQHNSDKLNIEREKLLAQQEIANKQLEIARENKNKYDVPREKKTKK